MSVPDYRLVPLSTLLNKSGEIVTRDVLSTFVPLTDDRTYIRKTAGPHKVSKRRKNHQRGDKE